jgi:uncharacterized repeat protein (TIGR01451 family)
MKVFLHVIFLIFISGNIAAQKITKYSPSNSNITQGVYRHIAIDNNTNHIWLSSNVGLSVWNDTTFQRFHTGNSGILSNFVSYVFIAGNEKWIGTDKGVSMYNGATWTNFDTSAHVSLKFITSITKDLSGNVFAINGNDKVILKYNGTSWTTVSYTATPTSGWSGLNNIFHTGGQVYAYGSYSKDLYKYNGTSFDTFSFPSAYITDFSIKKDTIFLHYFNNSQQGIFTKIHGINITTLSIPLCAKSTKINSNKKNIVFTNSDRINNSICTNLGPNFKDFVLDTSGNYYGIVSDSISTSALLWKFHESTPLVGGQIKIDACNYWNNNAGGVKVIIQPGNALTTTNSDGFWYIDSIPLGTYTATIDTTGILWKKAACSPISQTFQVTDFTNPTILNYFSVVHKRNCAYPRVTIFAPWLRRCFTNRMYVRVANDLSASQNIPAGTKVKVNLDSNLLVDSASLPYTLVSGIYEFNVPSLAPGQDTLICIWVTPKCNTTISGQSVCMNAEITPIQQCYIDSIPNFGMSSCNTTYDNTNYLVSSSCATDSVVFTISNSGNGNPSCPAPMKILLNGYEWKDTTITINAGMNKVVKFPKTGATYSVVVGNHPLHPSNTNAIAHQEFCGNSNNWYFGAANAWYNPSFSNYISNYCGILRASYDPNDKQVTPTGVGALGAIDSNSSLPMTYTIRFQNTGNDTAINVVIRDTLSSNLEIPTINTTSNTHPYTFQVLSGGVAVWTFQNIMLVDSATNEPLSKGSISYTINQKPNLAYGTQIKNTAFIYFDFNAPIITNTVLNTINTAVASTKFDTICDTFTFKGNQYTVSNLYKDTLVNYLGGDSIVFNYITIKNSSRDTIVEANYCKLNYLFIDTVVSSSGFYTRKLMKSNGCDSFKVLNISFVAPIRDTQNITSCNAYTYKSNVYHASQSFFDTITSGLCDTIRFVNLLINKIPVSKNLNGCKSVLFNAKSYNLSGTYADSISGACDTLYTLNITIIPYRDTLNISSCKAYSYKSTVYHSSKSFADTITSGPCDTFRWVNISVVKDSIQKTLTGCSAVIFNSKTYTTSGSYIDSLSTGVCDTIFGLTIVINPIKNTTVNINAFDSFSYKGNTYTSSQIVKDTLKTGVGCDSILSIDLKIKKLVKDSAILSGCSQVVYNGKTYRQNGTYKDTFVATSSDTIRTLFINIFAPTKDSISVTACNNYRFGDSVYTATGIYNYMLKTNKGCDSLTVLNLKINKVDKTVQRVGTQYISNEPDTIGVTYQWYICNPFRKISGATTRVFTTITKASFAVEIKNNVCKDTSICVSYNSSGIMHELEGQISLYPNPITDLLNIDFGMYLNEVEVSVYNVLGSEILSKKIKNTTKEVIDFSHLESGAYVLKIQTPQFQKEFKVSKF